MNTNEYLAKECAKRDGMKSPVAHMKLTDGFVMSVQASAYHYCIPREDLGPYTHVEIGFPSAMEPIIMEYIENDEDDPTETVYPYVPVEVVDAVIEKHGGIVNQ